MSRVEPSTEIIPQVGGVEMIRAMNRGVYAALREHKRLGQSVVVWDHENQRVVELPAEEIVVPEVDEVAPRMGGVDPA